VLVPERLEHRAGPGTGDDQDLEGHQDDVELGGHLEADDVQARGDQDEHEQETQLGTDGT